MRHALLYTLLPAILAIQSEVAAAPEGDFLSKGNNSNGASASAGKGRRSIDRRKQSTPTEKPTSEIISNKDAHQRAAPFIAKARNAYKSHPPKFAEAILNYQEALKIEDDVYTRMRLAQMYKYSQHYPEAEAEYERVRKYYQVHPEAAKTFAIGPPRGVSPVKDRRPLLNESGAPLRAKE